MLAGSQCKTLVTTTEKSTIGKVKKINNIHRDGSKTITK